MMQNMCKVKNQINKVIYFIQSDLFVWQKYSFTAHNMLKEIFNFLIHRDANSLRKMEEKNREKKYSQRKPRSSETG